MNFSFPEMEDLLLSKKEGVNKNIPILNIGI